MFDCDHKFDPCTLVCIKCNMTEEQSLQDYLNLYKEWEKRVE